MEGYTYTTLATLIAIIQIFIFSGKVGKLRGAKEISAPTMTGDDDFERAVRVHMNSIEQAVLFFPALWIFSTIVADLWAGVAGLAWIVGRQIYAMAYMNDPKKRSIGFMIGFLSLGVIVVWSLVVTVGALI